MHLGRYFPAASGPGNASGSRAAQRHTLSASAASNPLPAPARPAQRPNRPIHRSRLFFQHPGRPISRSRLEDAISSLLQVVAPQQHQQQEQEVSSAPQQHEAVAAAPAAATAPPAHSQGLTVIKPDVPVEQQAPDRGPAPQQQPEAAAQQVVQQEEAQQAVPQVQQEQEQVQQAQAAIAVPGPAVTAPEAPPPPEALEAVAAPAVEEAPAAPEEPQAAEELQAAATEIVQPDQEEDEEEEEVDEAALADAAAEAAAALEAAAAALEAAAAAGEEADVAAAAAAADVAAAEVLAAIDEVLAAAPAEVADDAAAAAAEVAAAAADVFAEPKVVFSAPGVLARKQPAANGKAAAAGAPASKKAAAGRKGAPAAGRRKPVPQAATPRSLVFVTAEVAPWSKTGGLGDVLGSLPIALAARGHRVMVVVPRYAPYDEPVDTGVRVDIMGAEVGFFHYAHKGVDWVFVDHPAYPRPGGLYADQHGVYGDNQFRFMLLALAGLEAPLQLPLGEAGLYGEDVAFIANDWHAALVPVYLAAKYRPHGVYTNARSVMAIHNLRHQGVFPPTTYGSLGLPPHWYNALEYQYPPHMRQGSFAEEGRSVNMLKGGISVADRVVTVSPGYAAEIRTYLGGWGLEGLLNARGPVLGGIVNGIDTEDWNPEVDSHLPVNYTAANFKRGKAACKAALQKELGLPVDPDVPLLAFIGRLDYQKGADIVLQAAPWMMSQGVQLVCLGTGSPDLENGLRWLEAAYRDQARGWVGFNVAMSHKITAAADILLMPSRFEPCGLNQLYAMAYGTVPIAHRTGGLKDTVIDFNPEEQSGTGWTFSNCDAAGLMHATGLALHTLREHPKDFEGIQRRGMQRDSSWNGAAQQYEEIIGWAINDSPYA